MQTRENSVTGDEYLYVNYTSPSPFVSSTQLEQYKLVRYYVNHVVIPAVLAFGAVGNVVVR